MKHSLQTCGEWQRQLGKQGVQMNVSKLVSTGGLLATACTHGHPLGALKALRQCQSKKSLRMVGRGKTGTSVLILFCFLVHPCQVCQVQIPIPIPVAPGTVFCATQSCEKTKDFSHRIIVYNFLVW